MPLQNLNYTKITKLLLVIIAWLNIIPYFCNLLPANGEDYTRASIRELNEIMPIVLIQNIEQQQGITGELLDIPQNIDENNYADLSSTVMSPNRYKALQKYDSNEGYKSSLRTKYYEVISKTLAKNLAKEIILDEVPIQNKTQIKEIDFSGIDNTYTYRGPNIIGAETKYISVSKGNEVMLIEYNGKQPIEKILNQIIDVL